MTRTARSRVVVDPQRRSRRSLPAAIARGFVFAIALAALSIACAATALRVADFRPTVLLVSLDGFRWDFAERAPTPHLDRLAAAGVRAERLLPVFPTKTFPNHYTQVTGLYPEHHGIVANNIYDPVLDARFGLGDRAAVGDARWYGGEPIWVTAERQGQLTAPLFWPGSEAAIGGVRPTYWAPYDGQLSNTERVDQVLGWLDLPAASRPRFLTLYFSDVDDAAHDFDPDGAPEVGAAVREVDAALGRLLRGLERRRLLDRVHLIVVSDHGMAATSRERVIVVDDYVDLAAANVVDWDPVLALWPDDSDREEVYRALAGAHPALTVYRREEIPERLHYREHGRIPPILGLAAEGWSISSRRYLAERPERFSGGNHGYDPELVSMGALFIATGPGLRRGAVVPPFENVHLYELMCHLLRLEPAPNDGSLEAVRGLLAGPGVGGRAEGRARTPSSDRIAADFTR